MEVSKTFPCKNCKLRFLTKSLLATHVDQIKGMIYTEDLCGEADGGRVGVLCGSIRFRCFVTYIKLILFNV